MLIYDIVPPKLKDTPPKRKALKISFWALFIGVIFSFFLTIFLFLQSTQTTTASPAIEDFTTYTEVDPNSHIGLVGTIEKGENSEINISLFLK